MGLNKSKGNMYEWITHTWNTVKGACPHDCSYCYMKRWGKQNPVRFDENELKTDLGEGNFIFVGSSCDMFAEDIPMHWIEQTVNHLSKYKNTYLFQSKNPYGILETMREVIFPDNYKICTTIETNRWYPKIMQRSPKPFLRAEMMHRFQWIDRFVTIEPIMDFDLAGMVDLIERCDPVQVNIGADSGRHNLPEPTPEKVRELILELEKFTKVKIKKNLFRICGSLKTMDL